MTKDEAIAFLKEIRGPDRRTISGDEYKQFGIFLKLSKPIYSSNNQCLWTDHYLINGKRYDCTYGIEEEPIIDEIVEEQD